MTRDFADFLDALNKEGASYVVIGGMAVLAHVPYRTTRDIDVLIEPSLENARKVRDAVRRWGGFEPRFTPEEFISGDVLSFGGLLRVEVHCRVPGASWEGVWARRVAGELLGVTTHFASVEDLIAMKESAARAEKDEPDLKRLRRLLERRRRT
jgi:predicted nucleotidyltransferase